MTESADADTTDGGSGCDGTVACVANTEWSLRGDGPTPLAASSANVYRVPGSSRVILHARSVPRYATIQPCWSAPSVGPASGGGGDIRSVYASWPQPPSSSGSAHLTFKVLRSFDTSVGGAGVDGAVGVVANLTTADGWHVTSKRGSLGAAAAAAPPRPPASSASASTSFPHSSSGRVTTTASLASYVLPGRRSITWHEQPRPLCTAAKAPSLSPRRASSSSYTTDVPTGSSSDTCSASHDSDAVFAPTSPTRSGPGFRTTDTRGAGRSASPESDSAFAGVSGPCLLS
mmetsp:Transcript_44820/g.133836  ORF Transcript_44820/g.133836 Transcript_44820/m.133836 type:complete len:288 (-) Transcript_44820:172-1035(-)